ncbi:MAG: UDP-N-acetylmuramate--L-alanine ligase, partial [Candidatus Omnitrophica bacterium]|nr:UDP-N-acetylmuramate--L-alanine ligase [Candidatus Omnitrophota bacterium]
GKTTTTSLLAHVLIEAGFSPSVAVGGILRSVGSNACCGKGALFVAEADESDGSFLHYTPRYSIITNIDHEHLDFYKTFERQCEAFREFMGKTQAQGALILCADDPHLMRLSRGYTGRVITYGIEQPAQVSARDITTQGLSVEFDCISDGEPLGRFHLALGGVHNAANALAVIACARELTVPLDKIKRAFGSYQGAGRRLEVKWRDARYTFIDDYAHHPTEISATMSVLKQLRPRRLVVVFQPHRYSRTGLLLDRFGECFAGADILITTDIYAAGEAPLEGVDGRVFFEQVKKELPSGDVRYQGRAGIAACLLRIIREGDVVVTMGAGDIVRIHDEVIKEIRERRVFEAAE